MRSNATIATMAVAALLTLPALEAPASAGPVQKARQAVSRVTQRGFRALARGKKGRVFHDTGVAYRGRLELSSDNPFGRAAGSVPVVVRLSRGAGRASEHPMILGVALRVPNKSGAPEDMLMVTSGKGRLGRRLATFRKSFFGAGNTYSSLTPVEIAGERALVRLEPVDRGARHSQNPTGGALAELQQRAAQGDGTFTFWVEPVKTGGKRGVARLTLEQPMTAAESKALHFDPWKNQKVHPAGWVNRLRHPAYRGSQDGRGALAPAAERH